MSLLEEQIINLISNTLGIEKELVQRNSHFFADFNADKMSMADLFLAVQAQFKLNLPLSELEKIQTVDELIKLIEDNSDEFV